MLFYYLWREGLLSGLGGEKIRFFLGLTDNPLYLSRRWPLLTAINWPRAVFSKRYALSVTTWLRYRVSLYDGCCG